MAARPGAVRSRAVPDRDAGRVAGSSAKRRGSVSPIITDLSWDDDGNVNGRLYRETPDEKADREQRGYERASKILKLSPGQIETLRKASRSERNYPGNGPIIKRPLRWTNHPIKRLVLVFRPHQ